MSRILNTYTEYVEPSNLFTEEEQEEQCCEILSPPPDSCADVGRTSDWNGVDETSEDSDNGSLQFDPEAIRAAHSNTPGFRALVLKGVGGVDGKCGQKHEEWTDSLGCCVNAPTPYWTQVATSLEWNHTYIFIVDGGTPPYTWDAEGNGLSVIGSGSSGRVTVTDCFCKPGTITVTDTCGKELTHGVTSEEGYWVLCDISEVTYPITADSGSFPATSMGSYVVFIGQNDEYKVQQRWSGVSVGPTAGGDARPDFTCAYTSSGYIDTIYVTPVIYNSFEECPDTTMVIRQGGMDYYPEDYTFGFHPSEVGLTAWKWECPGVEDLVYDDENSVETIGPDTYAYCWLDGGRLPMTVEVTGDGFFVDALRTQTSTLIARNNFRLYTNAEACGICNITVTDSCGNVVTGTAKCTAGRWLDRGANTTCLVTGEFTFLYNSANNHHYSKEEDGIKQYDTLHQGSGAAGATFSRISCEACPTDPLTTDYWHTYDPYPDITPCMTNLPDWYPCYAWIGAPGGDRFVCSPHAGMRYEEYIC